MFTEQLRKFMMLEKNNQCEYQKCIQEEAETQSDLSSDDGSELDISPKKNQSTASDFVLELQNRKGSGSVEPLEFTTKDNSPASIVHFFQGKKQTKSASDNKARTTVNSKRRLIDEFFESSFSEFSINEDNENGSSLQKCIHKTICQ